MSVATSSSSLACALAVFIDSIVIVEWLLLSAIALVFNLNPPNILIATSHFIPSNEGKPPNIRLVRLQWGNLYIR